MSFHGGFAGCVAAVVLFARKRGIPVLSLGDVTCAVGPIGLFLGRLANFINGELWGRPADVLPLPDGSLLVSDDLAGAIYRISYEGPAAP